MAVVAEVSPKRILLVEDDPAVRQSIKLLLGLDRHAVTEAANGPEALRFFSGADYDLVITDYLMPEMLGDELARSLKQLVPTQPVLMLTAYVERLGDAGKPADLIMPKPFSLEGLRQAIARPSPKRPAPEQRHRAEFRPHFTCVSEDTATNSGSVAEISPRDARAHVDSGTLILWVQQEVGFLKTPAEGPRPHDNDAERLLPLLTFAYACYILEGEQIALACQLDAPFRFLCQGSPPFPAEIIAFRRRHRRQLELALARTLTRVINQAASQSLACVEPAFLELARQRLDISRHLDLCS